jgi:hypothetical protein
MLRRTPRSFDQPLVVIVVVIILAIVAFRLIDVLRLILRLGESQTKGFLEAEGEA